MYPNKPPPDMLDFTESVHMSEYSLMGVVYLEYISNRIPYFVHYMNKVSFDLLHLYLVIYLYQCFLFKILEWHANYVAIQKTHNGPIQIPVQQIKNLNPVFSLHTS